MFNIVFTTEEERTSFNKKKKKKYIRPVPFSKKRCTPSTKKGKKQGENSSSQESEDETNLIKKHKIKFTVKRVQAGKRNYLPTDQTFESCIPEGLHEVDRNQWEKQVKQRKREISNDFKKVFRIETAVKKVVYSNQIRLRFPCPVKSCSFETVDIIKHLLNKHKWASNEVKLQTNYYNVVLDYITSMNTYQLHKPIICFKCALIFDRIDNHLGQKHLERGSNEYRETLKSYKKETQKLLYSANSFKHDKIHNVKKVLVAIVNFQEGITTTLSAIKSQETHSFDTMSHYQIRKSIVTEDEQPVSSSIQNTRTENFIPTKTKEGLLLIYMKKF